MRIPWNPLLGIQMCKVHQRPPLPLSLMGAAIHNNGQDRPNTEITHVTVLVAGVMVLLVFDVEFASYANNIKIQYLFH